VLPLLAETAPSTIIAGRRVIRIAKRTKVTESATRWWKNLGPKAELVPTSKEDFLLREACPGDITGLLGLVGDESLGTGWTASALREELESDNSKVFIAEVGSGIKIRVAGFLCVWEVLDQFEVGNLFVGAQYRRIGLGGQLVRHMISEAENSGISTILLEVRASNEAAKRLYLNAGFFETGIRENYYDGIHAATLMQLDLQ